MTIWKNSSQFNIAHKNNKKEDGNYLSQLKLERNLDNLNAITHWNSAMTLKLVYLVSVRAKEFRDFISKSSEVRGDT